MSFLIFDENKVEITQLRFAYAAGLLVPALLRHNIWFEDSLSRGKIMGLSWQQGPLSPGAIGRFLVPEPLHQRLLYIEPLRRRMRSAFRRKLDRR